MYTSPCQRDLNKHNMNTYSSINIFIFFLLPSDTVTHVVSEDSEASSVWLWLKEFALKNLPSLQVLDISWFTDSMREGRPVAVETRHLIQVINQTHCLKMPPLSKQEAFCNQVIKETGSV